MRPLSDFVEWPKVVVYDIESIDWINVVLLCHVDEYGNRLQFKSTSQYIDWLFSSFQGSHIWAHAGGRFDHRFLLPDLLEGGYDFRVAMSGNSIVLITLWNKTKKLYLGDSYRIMPDALKRIGKTVKLEKMDVNRSEIAQLRKTAKGRALLIEYCFRDCEIALKGLQLMRDALRAVNADFAFTLASIASRWVRRGDTIDWTRIYRGKKKDKNFVIADKFSQDAFFGGRTEMFRMGTFKGPIYYYDIISSYPASMLNDLPLYFENFVEPPTHYNEKTLREYLSHCGITEAWVNIPMMRVAPLAIKHHGERLAFPVGHKLGRHKKLGFPSTCTDCGNPLRSHTCRNCKKKYKKHDMVPGVWTNIELLAALDRGAEILPIIQARYTAVPFLRHFVNTFWPLRKQAKKDKDEFRAYAYKILLNSLYGKTVESIDRVAYVTSLDEIEKARENRADVRMNLLPGVHCIKSQAEGHFRHAAAGAYITAYSRLRLLEGLEHALKLGGDIFYCDTDSIMTNVKLDGLEGVELGQWKLEATFSEIELVLPKVYRAVVADTGEVIYRCKGVPIVREHDEPHFPALRWEAFKRYSETKDPAMAKLLTKEGLTGFVADINAGTLHPRVAKSKHGEGLLRCLQGHDKKREWKGDDSWPLTIDGNLSA